MAFSMALSVVGLKQLTQTFTGAGGKATTAISKELALIAEELVGEAQRNIRGSRATNPPQVLGVGQEDGGRLRGSITRDPVKMMGGALGVRIGPQRVVYAAIHEFGGKAGRGRSVTIPARPYLGPALEKKLDDIVDRLGSAYVGSVLEAA